MTDLDYTNNKIRQRCETCNELYLPRLEGDMADLNNLCRRCAEECAYQLSVDYNLPEGCSDEERQLALGEGVPPWTTIYTAECFTPSCSRYHKPWSTVIDPEAWFKKYGTFFHCFRCGQVSRLLRTSSAAEEVTTFRPDRGPD
jgi:hypothetical protein